MGSISVADSGGLLISGTWVLMLADGLEGECLMVASSGERYSLGS